MIGGIVLMTPEELDLAIESLLEGNPNQEKPERRRRNKHKDLMKRARSGRTVISEKMVLDILGEDLEHNIDKVEVSYISKRYYLGTVNGWYDDIKEIADYFGRDRSKLKLEKLTYYDWDTGKTYWEGNSRVYIDAYSVRLRFYNKEGDILRRYGTFRDVCIKEDIEVEEGVYEYTDEMKDFVRGCIGKAPEKTLLGLYELNHLRYNIDELFKDDKKGRYKHHRKAMEEFDKYNHYSGTIRIQKGDLLGTKSKLVSAVNVNLKNKNDTFEGLDKLVQDFETAYYDVIYEYIW